MRDTTTSNPEAHHYVIHAHTRRTQDARSHNVLHNNRPYVAYSPSPPFNWRTTDSMIRPCLIAQSVGVALGL